MKTKYFNRISALLLRVRPELGKTRGLEFKDCFGAVAGYVRGRIFVSCGKFGIALQLPSETIARLLTERGAKPLKYFAKGHVKKDYVVIPPAIVEDETRFGRLVLESVRFVEDEAQ